MADLATYIEASIFAEKDFQQPSVWSRKAILNVARVGYFSSDRTICEYARDIWNIKPAGSSRETVVLPLKAPVSAEITP
jgi:starch phosphorylase